MNTTQGKIASRLEQAFSSQGFADTSVARLKEAAGVSLRTLYKYYPSREAMVTGALDFRHRRYLAFLAEGEPPPGRESVLHLLQRLADWMEMYAPNGCMSMNALNAYPDNRLIRGAVKQHKQELIRLLARRSGEEGLAHELFLIHEGASAAWPLIGTEAIRTAQQTALKLIKGDNNG